MEITGRDHSNNWYRSNNWAFRESNNWYRSNNW